MTPFLRRTFLFVLCLTAITGYAFAQAPTVSPDTYTTQQDTPLVVPAGMGVLANDTGYDSATHRLESYDPLSQYGAVITLAADGSFTYTPEPGFVGLDTFSYTVRNSFGATVGVVSISVTPPPGVANDDSYTLTPHLTFVSPTSVTANDVDVTSITGFGDSLGTANGTSVNGSNFITAGGAGGRVILNPDGTFTYYPDAGDVNTSATFFYTINSLYAAQVTLTFTNQEQVWVVDSTPSGAVCTGGNSGTPACPFANFGDAWGGTSTANDTILVDSGAYTCGVTLLNGQRVLGAGTSDTVAAATGIAPQPGSTYAPYGTFSGTRPTLTTSASSHCFNLGQNNTVRGLNIGSTLTGFYAISGTSFGTLTTSQVSISEVGGVLSLSSGTLNTTFDSLATTASNNTAIELSLVGGTINVTGTTSLSNIVDIGFQISSSSVAATFNSLNITAVTATGAEGIFLSNNIDPAFNFISNGGAVQGTSGHNIFISNSGNVILSNMVFNTPGATFSNIAVENGRGTNNLFNVTLNGTRSNGFFIQSTLPGSSTWTLTDVDCTTSGAGINESCIVATASVGYSLNLNLIGTALGQSILRARTDAVSVRANGSGAQVRFNMDSVRLTDPTSSSSRRGGLLISAENSGSIDYVVQRSEFLNLYPDGFGSAMVRFVTSGSSSTSATLRGRFSNNTISTSNSANNNAIELSLNRAGTFEADILDNTVNVNGIVTILRVALGVAITDADVRIARNLFNENNASPAPGAGAISIGTSSGSGTDIRFLVDDNDFTTASTTSINSTVSISGAAFFLSTTFTNNTFNSANPSGNDVLFQHSSTDAITCAAFTGNSGTPAPTAGFTQTAGTFQVANLASLTANNPGMTFTTSGTLTNVTACPNVVLSGAIPAFPNLLP